MTTPFENTYDLSESQLLELEKAEEMMLKNDLGNAETLLLGMLEQDRLRSSLSISVTCMAATCRV